MLRKYKKPDPMKRATILLLGGAGETRALAEGLLAAGWQVLVSTATDYPLELGCHPNLRRRAGPLDEAWLEALLQQEQIAVVLVATHPYAVRIRALAHRVAAAQGLPCIHYERPAGTEVDGVDANLIWADDHAEAARLAVAPRLAVLLTIGANNLAPYVEAAREAGCSLTARVLPREASLRRCRELGLPDGCVIAKQGPFSIEQNREHLHTAGAGVLVTKNSGMVGGFAEKIEAARLEGCLLVIVRRPEHAYAVYRDISAAVVAAGDAVLPIPVPRRPEAHNSASVCRQKWRPSGRPGCRG